MQAIILAAGKGTRLGKYTVDNTKCMLEVNGEKLIDLSLKNLEEVGIKKVILVVGYQKKNLIEYLGKKKFGIEIIYVHNDDYDTTNNIYSLFLARKYLKEDDTLLLESDLIYDVEILKGIVADPRPSLAVVDKYRPWMDGTVMTLGKDSKITSFVPKKFFDYSRIESYYKTVNIYKFSKEFSINTYVPFLIAYSKALGNNEYYEQVLRVILQLENQELEAYPLNEERWYEIDDVQDKDNAELVFANNPKLKLSLTQKRYGGFWRYHGLRDFCYLVNPYFPGDIFLKECQNSLKSLISQYPSGAQVQSLLAGKLFNVEQDTIAVTNGAAETIKVLSKVLEGTFGIMEPTFYEYIDAIGLGRMKRKVLHRDDCTYNVSDLFELAKEVDNLILINPDNPSGGLLKKKDVLELLDYLASENKHLILDESFIDFAQNGFSESLLDEDILEKYPNLIIIKSISKSYGVPGIRLGVTVSYNRDIIKDIIKEVSIWNVNSLGEFFLQIIGKYQAKYKASCQKIIEERERFYNELKNISFLTVYPSQANYFFCRLNSTYTATELAEKLLFENDIFIKDLTGKTGINGKNYIRIAVRDKFDNNALIEALKKK